MIRSATALLALGFCTLAGAQVSSFADVKAKGGVQLGAADLKELMPGAKVISRTPTGSTRSWSNKPDGTFVASSDSRGFSTGRTVYVTASGTWRVSDEGRFCVKIQWTTIQEDWCRLMFKVGDKYYGVGKLDDTAQASEFEFSK